MYHNFFEPLKFILLFAIVFTSCSSDDDFFDQSKSTQIIGTWDLQGLQEGSFYDHSPTAKLEFRKDGKVIIDNSFSIMEEGIQDYVLTYELFTLNDPLGERDVLTLNGIRFLIEIGLDNDNQPSMNMLNYGNGDGKIAYTLVRREKAARNF